MKILFVYYRYDYDKYWRRTKRDHMTDYYLWYEPLVRLGAQRGHTVDAFWVDEVVQERGLEGMRQEYYRILTAKDAPDVAIYMAAGSDIGEAMFAKVQKNSRSLTVSLCGDDSWAFDRYYKQYVPYFSWILAWCARMVPRYRAAGCKNVLVAKPIVNIAEFRPQPGPKTIDVSFVGTRGEARAKIIAALRRAGIDVLVRGNGWPEGAVLQKEMLEIISHSKIALTLNPPEFYFGIRQLVRLFFRWRCLGETGSDLKWDGGNFIANFRLWMNKRRVPGIKGRHAETPALGTMQITLPVDGIEDYFEPGKEIVLYSDNDDLVKKIRYYLAHDEEREAIARAGYLRTVRDYNSEKCINDLFLELESRFRIRLKKVNKI